MSTYGLYSAPQPIIFENMVINKPVIYVLLMGRQK